MVADRRVYLHTLQSYERRMWTYNSPAPNTAIRPLIEVFHDESTFYTNADKSFHWTDGNKQVLKQKSLGQAIMVSDFVEEVGGEGCWNLRGTRPASFWSTRSLRQA